MLNCYWPEIKGQILIACFILLSQVYWLHPRGVQFSKQILGIKVKHWCSCAASRKQWSRAVSSGRRFKMPEWAANFAIVCVQNEQQEIKHATSSSMLQKMGLLHGNCLLGVVPGAFWLPGNRLRGCLELVPDKACLWSDLVLLHTIQLIGEAPSSHGIKKRYMKKKEWNALLRQV